MYWEKIKRIGHNAFANPNVRRKTLPDGTEYAEITEPLRGHKFPVFGDQELINSAWQEEPQEPQAKTQETSEIPKQEDDQLSAFKKLLGIIR